MRTLAGRKISIAVLAAVATLLLVGVVGAAGAALAGKPANVNPRTTAIIDYAEPFDTHKPNHNPPGRGPGGPPAVDHTAGHFELIGGVWADANPATAAVDPKLAFVIDLRGFPAGSGPAILNGFDAWEQQTAGDLLDEAATTFADVTVALGDGVNTYSMRNLGGRVLASTFITWDDANDNNAIDTGEQFLEMDVVFNLTVSWAIDPDGEGPLTANVNGKWFDVQNVATHEDGHVFGLAHPGSAHPEDEDQTMFASAAPKETKKQSLEANGDIPGIQSAFLGYLAP